MQVHEARTPDDIQHTDELRNDEVWEHARAFLSAAPGDPFADHLRWLEEDGRPVACVQVFLHRHPIGCAEVGMCLPEYPFVPPELRGRGHFKRVMADLHRWAAAHGHPFSYCHGRKGLYTGIGYAPCMHHCTVLLRTADALRLRPPTHARPATAEDVAVNASLFRGPFPLGRGLQCRDEAWRPEPGHVLLAGTPDGFAVTGRKSSEGVLDVTDAWAATAPAAAALVRAVADAALEAGCEWLRLNCRREDTLARLAVLAGGQLRWSAAQERAGTETAEDVDAFHLTDLRLALAQMLPELNRRWQQFGGQAPAGIVLAMEEESVALELGPEVALAGPTDGPTARLPRTAMTQALMGYATPTELSLLHEGCTLPPGCRAALNALFPATEPHLVHEETAFAGPDRFGIVP